MASAIALSGLAAESPLPPPAAAGVSSLVAMGFPEDQVTTALAENNGDINRALSSLVGEAQAPPSPQPTAQFMQAAHREPTLSARPEREGAPTSSPESNPFLRGLSAAMSRGGPADPPAFPFMAERSRPRHPAIASRRARATPAEREAATQAATQAEDARGPSQGTRGNRRRQAETAAEERPARRQRTTAEDDGPRGATLGSFFRTHTLNFETNFGGVPATVTSQVLNLSNGPDGRPPFPASIERIAARAAAGAAAAQHRGGASGTDDGPDSPDGRPDPFRFGPGIRMGQRAAGASGSPPPGLPLSFVFEIAQEVMRAAGDRQPDTRGAKKEIVDALPTVAGGCTDETCPVCQDNFTDKEEPTRMPCGHTFHLECLKPWLEEHNTCPTCRYELDTENERYNQQLARQRDKLAQQREKRVKTEITRVSTHAIPATA